MIASVWNPALNNCVGCAFKGVSMEHEKLRLKVRDLCRLLNKMSNLVDVFHEEAPIPVGTPSRIRMYCEPSGPTAIPTSMIVALRASAFVAFAIRTRLLSATRRLRLLEDMSSKSLIM